MTIAAKNEDKKTYRVIGIKKGDDMAAYGANIENALNELHAQGYETLMVGDDTGVLVHGKLIADSDSPLTGLLSMIKSQLQPHGRIAKVSALTEELLRRAARYAGPDASEQELAEVKKHAHTVTQGFTVEELNAAAKEIHAWVDGHKESECSDGCGLNRLMAAVLATVKQESHANLQ
jgi:hypothetical protein